MYIHDQLKKPIFMLIALCTAITIGQFLQLSSVSAHTDEPNRCENTILSSQNNATINTQTGKYQTYIRVNPSIETNISISSSVSSSTDCQFLGEKKIKGSESWVKTEPIEIDSEINNIYTSYSYDGPIDVKPEILLIPFDLECTPQSCTTKYRSKKYDIAPKKISYTYDSMGVYVQSLPTDFENQVARYYLGDSFVYKSTDLSLDESRFPPGEHLVTQVVQFDDGTSFYRNENLTLETTLQQFLSPYFYKYKKVLTYLGVFILFTLLWMLLEITISSIKKRLIWKKTHLPSNNKQKVFSQEEKYKIAKRDADLHSLKTYSKKVILIPVAVFVCFTSLITWVLSDVAVDGISMETTLPNDSKHILYKLPVTISNVLQEDFVPNRGDVVMFEQSNEHGINDIETENIQVIKRVIGLPGETIRIINNKAQLVEKDGSLTKIDEDSDWEAVLQSYDSKNELTITLDHDEIFVLGDNRVDSLDSRHYGPIKVQDIKGEVLYKHNDNLKPLY